MADSHCADCGKILSRFGSVHLGSADEGYRELCLACYNAAVAAHCGVNFQHADFEPISLADVDGLAHHFEFAYTLLGDRVELSAHEISDDPNGGYEFSVLSLDPEGEPLQLFRQLFEKMRRALSQKHLREHERYGTQIAESGIVRGSVGCDMDIVDVRVPMLMIDGKPISWERFGEMLMTYEGFSFKLEVFDRTDER